MPRAPQYGMRERLRVVADRHPLPLGELVPVRRAAEPAAVARDAHAAERDDRLVVDGLVVDVDHAAPDPLREREPARDRARVDGAREPVLAVVRAARAPPRRSRRSTTGATGPKISSVQAGGSRGHVGEDGRPVEQPLVRAALDEPRAAVDRAADDVVHAGELLLVDDRARGRRPPGTGRRGRSRRAFSTSASM